MVQTLSHLWSDARFRTIALVSVGVTLVGCVALVTVAHVRGLDPMFLTGDARGYVELAENIREHGVFSVSSSQPFEPESFRAPGYPAFLAVLFSLFGASLTALLVHAFIVSVAPIFLYLLIRPLHERVAFWASIVFIFDPIRLFLASSFLSDALFTALLLATLAITLSVREGNVLGQALITGLLLGVCILVRPIAIFLPLLVVLFFLVELKFSRHGFIAGFLVGVSALIVIAPWMYRNHTLFGSWNIASVGVANLMLYNAPEFLEWQDDEKGRATLVAFQREQETLPRHEALSLARSDVFEDMFLSIIEDRKLEYAFFHIVKTIPFFLTDGLRDIVRLLKVDIGSMPNLTTALMRGDISSVISYVWAGNLAVILLIVGSAFWAVCFLLFVAESIRALFVRDIQIIFFSMFVLYFAFLTGPVSNARYREPIAGLIFALAISIVFRWYDARHENA